jgi:hypothetical protein
MFGSVANAAVVTTGDMTLMPSSTANYNAAAFDDPAPAPIRVWQEQSHYRLMADVVLDTDLADPSMQYGTNTLGDTTLGFDPASGPILEGGRRVDVFYIAFDPAGDQTAGGSVTFDNAVLGIIAYTARLPLTDYLRVPGAPYPASPYPDRGWESLELTQLSADRRTLSLDATAADPGDHFRVFVVAAPEPSTYAMLSMSLGALLVRALRQRRRSRKM